MFSLSTLNSYQGKWQLVNSEKLDEQSIKSVSVAKIVKSDYGKSVQFFLYGGGYKYMPLSNNGKQPNVGEVVDLQKVTIETLHRDGSKDINRCRIDDL